MALKTIFFLLILILGSLASILYHPLIGVLTYILTYNISPAHRWWGAPLWTLGIQYGKVVVASIALGMLLHRNKLKYKKFFHKQEIFLILFVIIIWFSHFWGLPEGSLTDRNAIKMTKVLIFLLMFSHIVTDLKRYEAVIWTMILVGLYQGYAAYNAPSWAFRHGRLNIGVGGPDFMEGNFLGAHFAMLLPFIGVMFLKGTWKSKFICLLAAVLIINGIILTRSRGVFLGCAMGFLTALAFTIKYMKGKRLKIITLAIVGVIGALTLTDPGFWQRMATLKKENLEQLDLSAKGRIWAWQVAFKMVKKYSLGIGEGNFKQYTGMFDERTAGKDTHNTYLRCLAELGIPGFLVLLAIIFNSFLILRKIWKIAVCSQLLKFQWHIFALTIALIIFLTCGFFITETYIEEFYWLLMFPTVLSRCVENQSNFKEER